MFDSTGVERIGVRLSASDHPHGNGGDSSERVDRPGRPEHRGDDEYRTEDSLVELVVRLVEVDGSMADRLIVECVASDQKKTKLLWDDEASCPPSRKCGLRYTYESLSSTR